MATTATISQRELKRLAGLGYEGKTLRVMLCAVGDSGFTAESTVANWQSVEIVGNGYVRYSAVVGTGSYSEVTASYNMPVIDAAFTASGDGYSYDRIIAYINGETYIHSEIVEDPNITMAANQSQTYRIELATDD
jgi:hypothetical protein